MLYHYKNNEQTVPVIKSPYYVYVSKIKVWIRKKKV